MEIIQSFSYRKDADNVIFIRHSEDCCDLIANAVVISDVAFIPAALITEFNYCQKHILDSG